MTPFIGVRISWLMLARNSDFSREASIRLLARLDQRLLRRLAVADVAQDAGEEALVAHASPSPHETSSAISRPSVAQARRRAPRSRTALVAPRADAVEHRARAARDRARARASRTAGRRLLPARSRTARSTAGLAKRMRPPSSTVMMASGAVSASSRYCASPIASASCASASSVACRRKDSSRTSCRATRCSAASCAGRSDRGLRSGDAQHADRQPAVDHERQRRVEPELRADLRSVLAGTRRRPGRRRPAARRARERRAAQHRRRAAGRGAPAPRAPSPTSAISSTKATTQATAPRQRRGNGRQVVEVGLRLRVDDRARPQRPRAAPARVRSRPADHDGDLSGDAKATADAALPAPLSRCCRGSRALASPAGCR